MPASFRLLGAWSVVGALLFGSGCTAIIDGELGNKPLAGGTGGAAPDAGDRGDAGDAGDAGKSDAGDAGNDAGPLFCTSDTECAGTPNTPACDVANGACVECLPSDDKCPPGEHCATSMTCAATCVKDSDCPSLPDATSVCASGVCELGACSPGFGNCDGISTNGCEVDLQTAPGDCGSCANACSLTVLNASVTCNGGVCQLGTCDPGFQNCDGLTNNGCEVDSHTDVNNCGACKSVCMLPNAAATCSVGACAVAACTPGFLDCDKSPANGCEVAKYSDPLNCGGCGNVCVLPNATTTCTAGVCLIDSCNAGYGDCDGDPTNGCETDLHKSPTNCGACGMACSTNHAVPSCSAGVCTLACEAGFQNCDGNVANGCDAQTSNTVTDCGACGKVCPSAGGTPSCIASTCSVTPCPTNLGNCDGSGCNVRIDGVSDCGGCGVVCTTPHGTPACVAGACATLSCNPGFADCNGKPIDGCETITTSDLANCGGCNQTCAPPHANAVCAGGTCTVGSCTKPFADCDGSATNGCEVDTSSNAANCGACGIACNGTNGTPSCSGGKCSIACSSGFGDCDGNAADGCEANLKTDPNHCGACSTACSLPHAVVSCSNGTCAVKSCIAPFADCDGIAANGCETDTSTSPSNCGACGTTCNAQHGTATCNGSSCGIVCSAGYANCDGMLSNGCEAVLASDVNNCGGCGAVCPSAGGTPNCIAGVCGFASCQPGLGNCAGTGCTTDLTRDPANCGACGNVCSVANGVGSCAGSSCSIASCKPGFDDCDGSYADGCETKLATSANCGACGVTCNLPNATSTCSTGSCALVSCVGSFADCDHVASNGCETDLSSDVGNCGACGNACSTVNAAPTCVSAACTLTCSAGFGDCDQNPSTGCEANTTSDPLNCGACGRACATTNVASLDCSLGLCAATCALGFANCSAPLAPTADDGCETNVSMNANACGSCANACGSQGAAAQPLVCGAGAPSTCGCAVDAACNLGAASGTCGAGGLCQCNGAACNPGEVCVNAGMDACSCNGAAACNAPDTCCQTPSGCVDLTSTPSSCGACGHACPPGFACQASQCACTADTQCNAGASGVCAGGSCQCGGVACATGQRCQPSGSCG